MHSDILKSALLTSFLLCGTTADALAQEMVPDTSGHFSMSFGRATCSPTNTPIANIFFQTTAGDETSGQLLGFEKKSELETFVDTMTNQLQPGLIPDDVDTEQIWEDAEVAFDNLDCTPPEGMYLTLTRSTCKDGLPAADITAYNFQQGSYSIRYFGTFTTIQEFFDKAHQVAEEFPERTMQSEEELEQLGVKINQAIYAEARCRARRL